MALLLIANRRFSLVDCTSFRLIRRLDSTRVLAFDRHFAEQGFEAIPAGLGSGSKSQNRRECRHRAENALSLLRDVFETVDLTQQVLMQAMDARFPDFEDAIQYFSAVHAGANFIVTRNAEDFPRTGPTATIPAEWLAIVPE